MTEGCGDHWTTAALKCYIDRTLGDMRGHFERMHSDRDKAVELAFGELQRRLDILNSMHEEMRKRDAGFYSKEMHDSFNLELQRDLTRIRASIVDTKKPDRWWAAAAATVLVAIIVGIIWNARTIERLSTNQQIVMQHQADLFLSLKHHEEETAKAMGKTR